MAMKAHERFRASYFRDGRDGRHAPPIHRPRPKPLALAPIQREKPVHVCPVCGLARLYREQGWWHGRVFRHYACVPEDIANAHLLEHGVIEAYEKVVRAKAAKAAKDDESSEPARARRER